MLRKGLVRVSHAQLRGADCAAQLVDAFREGGLGAIAVTDVPGFPEQRRRLLRMGHRLAHQPEAVLQKLEHPASLYNAGWSKGREKIGNMPDEFKGSFYANPIRDRVGLFADTHPFFYPDNIWPKEDMPELEPAFKELGKTMFETILLLASQIDRFCEAQIGTYERGSLLRELSSSQKVKGRLLYYYPPPEGAVTDNDWIGWHNDSGFLTALTAAQYFDEDTGEEIANPDPRGGLYVVDRNSEETKLDIPASELIIQCGECLQVHTGGLLVATPHAVRPSVDAASGGTKRRVGRATFPVFVDSGPLFPLSPPAGVTRAQVLRSGVSSRVPPLAARWKDGAAFVDFLGDTFRQYYEWDARAPGKSLPS